MDEIYLLTKDGHKDSLDLSYFYTNEEEIIKSIKNYYKQYYFDIFEFRNFKIDSVKKEVTFEYFEIDTWEEDYFNFIIINKYND